MRAEIVTFTASLVINTALLTAFDRAVSRYESALEIQKQKEVALEKLGGLQFEFVEAPVKTSPQSPLETKKVSDRDAVAQDQTQQKENAARAAPPKIETEGPADQLEQRRLEPSQAPSAASMPSVRPSATPEPQAPESPVQDALPDSSIVTQTAPSPFSTPTKPVQDLSGLHRINTQAMSRVQSHGAQVYGATSFEATGSGMGQYMKNVKERVWLAWFPYVAFHYPKDFRAADAAVAFTLDAEGQVRRVNVVASEGGTVFAAFCVEAVQRAAPFGPLPAEILDLIGKDELEVQFAFHFW